MKHNSKTSGNKNSSLKMIMKRFCKHKLAVASLCFLGIITIFVILAPFIAPYNPNQVSQSFAMPPSSKHWLGTDQIGRDMLSRLLYATRISLFVGFAVTVISTIIGVILGLVAGYFGGFVDIIIMRITDTIMSFPYILLVLVAAAIFNPGLWNIILILGFVDWPGAARLVRGNVLSLRETNFIKGNVVAGMPNAYILFSEILPNTVGPVLVYATSVFAISILDEAALSFLGMGVQTPTASLGNMLNGAESITILTSKFWLWVPAGVVIILLVVSINFVGDALRDAIDPSAKE
jgi:peptide/nickel transport system permease protein